MAFEDVRGRMGQQVVSRTRGGLVAKRLPKYKYPKVGAVQQGAERMRQANSAWNALTLPQVEAWRTYAAKQTRVDPVTGTRYPMDAKNAFVGLATKFIQMRPADPAPLDPPSTPGPNERIGLQVSTIAGGVRFTASGPNSAGVVTEVLAQVLPNVRRSPTKFYKSLAFHAFAGSSLDVPLDAGVYAFAYRFVRWESGQQTEWIRLAGVWELGG